MATMSLSNKGLDVRETQAAEYEQWNSVLAAADEGSSYQSPEYLSLLAETTGASTRFIGVYQNGDELVGGVGVYEEPGWLGVSATSRTLLYYNGPFIKRPETLSLYKSETYRRHILECLEEYLRRAGYRFVRFKVRNENCDYRPFLANGWSAKPVYTYVMHITDLELQWERIDKNLRRLIRRCKRDGMTMREDGNFESFFDMHEDVHRVKGAPIYMERDRFRAFVRGLVALRIGRLFQAYTKSGEPAASQLVLCGRHEVAHTLAAASSRSHQKSGCNAFLRWAVCEWLAERGFKAVDLTDAHNPQVARFKSQLGADVRLGLQLELPQASILEFVEKTVATPKRIARQVVRVMAR